MQNSSTFNAWKSTHPVLLALASILAGSAGLAGGVLLTTAALFLLRTPAGAAAGSFFTWLFSGDPPNSTWYITRAAGLVAYLLLWLSTLYGLALSTRILNGSLHGSLTLDLHQVLSLLALGFTALHMIILLFDRYIPFSLAQLLVPMQSAYRPLWVGFGIISLYISILVTATFYLRKRIGMRTFRLIHISSLAGFFGAALHGLYSGSDSSLPVVQGLYIVSMVTVAFLLCYRVVDKAMLPSTSRSATRQTARRQAAQPGTD